jgi:outer membrane protein assembly factor BamA
VLIVPIGWRRARVSWNAGQEREDLFSPVDGLNPSIGTTVTLFDRSRFNHTVIDASASYKFAREAAGYSLGAERPLFGGPRLFAGAEIHDLSASDDLWRVTAAEQTLAALLFKNTFRDYYRRHGGQVFTTLQPGGHNELTLAARWDRHAPLDNETGFSVFRDSASFRPNTPAFEGDVNAWVIGYRFDTRPLSGAGERQTYLRHLTDDLYGFGRRRTPGLRVEWTSELAGRGLGGDARFDRHILDTRGYLSFSPRQLIAARALLGFSNGRLIPEREFALGGIGSVHGYSFKEARGAGMALFNGEYAFDLLPSHYPGGSALSIFGFYDAGRVFDPVPGSRSDWLKGVGFGFSSGQWLRIEIGFRAGAIPSSRQVLVRLGPSF